MIIILQLVQIVVLLFLIQVVRRIRRVFLKMFGILLLFLPLEI